MVKMFIMLKMIIKTTDQTKHSVLWASWLSLSSLLAISTLATSFEIIKGKTFETGIWYTINFITIITTTIIMITCCPSTSAATPSGRENVTAWSSFACSCYARHFQDATVLISATVSNFEMNVENNDNLLSMLLLQLLSSVTLLYCLALSLIDEP